MPGLTRADGWEMTGPTTLPQPYQARESVLRHERKTQKKQQQVQQMQRGQLGRAGSHLLR